ncbi:FlgD immunoglobulin-like domain containing protein [Maribacter stanieri]|uniref:FlgD immunoglobulin-like domain containing protein n=1 Tax=Maribacter stanieri TaxID=440514 RepID=UPI0024954FCD|nr:FlgD immunoglobulin-like domain containing protein [Maribacter stanieri]
MKILYYFLFLSYVLNAQNYHYVENKNTAKEVQFYLDESARTSAGVYKGDILLRTLWSNVLKKKGTHSIEWDGLDDEGFRAPNGNYEIKILSNNVNYEWLSPIGNTSNKAGGPLIMNNAEVIQGMVQIGDYIYYNCGYNENPPSFAKFHVDTPNVNIPVLSKIHYGLDVPYIATDGNQIYFAGHDPWNPSKNSMVFAIDASTEEQVIFKEGQEYTLASNHKYNSVISSMKYGKTTSEITGLAVQDTGDYLYVARGKKDSIYVYDKITGDLKTTIDKFINPRKIITDGAYLWVVSGTNTVAKYSLNVDGSINKLSVNLTGITEPLAIAIKNNGEIAVSDNETQQIKIFNSVGHLIDVLGVSGGYATSPDVAVDKFMFVNPSETQMGTFLFYQKDGKLWVGDTGNFRSQRFNIDQTLDVTIMYLCWVRSMGVDRNNPRRVFANYLEFDVDIVTGDWSFAKNWMNNFIDGKDNEFHRLKWVTTMSNGRTYAFQEVLSSQWEVVELSAFGLRYTGIYIDKSDTAIFMEDGNIRKFDAIQVITNERSPLFWREKTLIGFEDNNPIWGDEIIIGSTGNIDANSPIFRSTIGHNFPPRADTSSDLLISFEGGSSNTDYASDKYHLGATKKNGEGFLWKTAIGTDPSYTGDYPNNGMFDMGNGVQYPGGVILVKERSIFWNYHGEFWKNMQTNKFQHVYDNGLLLGVFGVAGNEQNNGSEVWGQIGVPGMAGNNLKGDIVKISEDYYILHGDEGHHGAVHRWKVSNLKSIQERVVPVTIN